jgi:hypothetical protein
MAFETCQCSAKLRRGNGDITITRMLKSVADVVFPGCIVPSVSRRHPRAPTHRWLIGGPVRASARRGLKAGYDCGLTARVDRRPEPSLAARRPDRSMTRSNSRAVATR